MSRLDVDVDGGVGYLGGGLDEMETLMGVA